MDTISSATDFLKRSIHTAHYFGFEPLDTLKKHPDCKSCEEKILHKAGALDRRSDALNGLLTSGICSYFDNKLNGIEGPVLFYTLESVPRTGETAIALHALNIEKSIAEAIIIQTIHAILSESGYPQHVVRINSLGDQDSMVRYTRELTNYLRKRMNDLPPASRELMKDHVFSALNHLVEKQHDLGLKSPSPLEYLSDASRRHFREIVEFLDMSDTPYEIDTRLLGHHHCYSDTMFAFDLLDDERVALAEQPIYARGGRYNTFVSRMTRTTVPATGAVVVLQNKKAPARFPRPVKRSPKISVIQLGFGPKVQSLLLLNELRQAGIDVTQDVISDSLGAQLRRAEGLNTRFALIIGQKEYIEGNVILRDLHSRTQDTLPRKGLITHLKRVAR